MKDGGWRMADFGIWILEFGLMNRIAWSEQIIVQT